MAYKLWNNARQPVGVVQIIKNRDENLGRYNDIANFLNQNRYLVWADELYQNQPENAVFDNAVDTELKTVKFLTDKFNLPVFLVGDGYGSFIVQKIMHSCAICTAGVCLAGGGRYSNTELRIGVALSWMGKKIWGDDKCPSWLQTKSKTHNCKSYDYWFNLFKNLQTINYELEHNIPLLIIAGQQDINSFNGRLARSLYNAYSEHNLQNLTLIIYPDAGGNLLFVPEYADVKNDILSFLNAAVKQA